MSLPRVLSGAVGGVVLTVAAASASPVVTPARLSVTVVGPEGNSPAAAVWVAAVDPDSEDAAAAREEILPPGRRRTLWELPRGRYQVLCAARGGGWRRLPPVELEPGDEVPVICRLPRTGVAEVTVVDAATGEPVEGASVEAAFLALGQPRWPPGALPFLRSAAAAVSDRDGVARLAAPDGSRSAVLVRGEGLATAVIPEVSFRSPRVARARIGVQPGGTLDVRVLPTGPGALEGWELVPVPGATPPGGGAFDVQELLRTLHRTTPGPDGRVVWRGLAPGVYRIEAVATAPARSGMLLLGLAAVRPNGVTVLDLPLGRVTVTGTIAGLARHEGEGGAGLSSATVWVGSWHGGQRRARLRDLAAPGEPPRLEYRVTVPAGSPGLLELAIGGDDLVVGVVDPGDAADGRLRADFQLPEGEVRVEVVDATGTPVPGAAVRASAVGGPPENLRQARTGADGTAHLRYLAAGRWRIAARAAGIGVSPPLEVTVQRGTTAVTLTLERGETLAGCVRDAAGRPVAGAVVACAPSSVPTLIVETRTDARGRFAVAHLPPGEVAVVARPPRLDPGIGFAFANVDVRLGRTVELAFSRGAARGVLLVPPEELAGEALSPLLGWEIDGVRLPHRLVRRCVGLLPPADPERPGLLLGGFPPGRYRLTLVAAGGRVLGRSRPFELGGADPGRPAVVRLELDR